MHHIDTTMNDHMEVFVIPRRGMGISMLTPEYFRTHYVMYSLPKIATKSTLYRNKQDDDNHMS